jgi:hypothetical protein
MSTPTPKKKIQTRHADAAINMACRLPGVMFDILYARLGLDGAMSETKDVAASLGISSVECNRLYERAIALTVAAVDSEEVSAEDIPDLLVVGWMRRDDSEGTPCPVTRQKIDGVLGGGAVEMLANHPVPGVMFSGPMIVTPPGGIALENTWPAGVPKPPGGVALPAPAGEPLEAGGDFELAAEKAAEPRKPRRKDDVPAGA